MAPAKNNAHALSSLAEKAWGTFKLPLQVGTPPGRWNAFNLHNSLHETAVGLLRFRTVAEAVQDICKRFVISRRIASYIVVDHLDIVFHLT
jgi:hypothetical protein